MEQTEQQPSQPAQELYRTDLSVGEILRRTRVHYDRSIQDIERALHIRASQIEAIETDQIEKLPGRVYAIGFVRSYAEYLGLDGDKMVHLFKVQSGAKARSPELTFPVPASESKIPPGWMVVLSVVAAFIIITIWLNVNERDRAMVTEIPNATEVQSSLGAGKMQGDQGLAQDANDRAADAGAQPEVTGVILRMEENSWVEIRDKEGKALVSRVLKKGDQYFVPDRPDLVMALGNAGGVRIEIDGQDIGFLGKSGEILRDISLDNAYLRENYLGQPSETPQDQEQE